MPGLKGQQEKLNGTFRNGLLVWMTHPSSLQFMVMVTSACSRLKRQPESCPCSDTELTAAALLILEIQKVQKNTEEKNIIKQFFPPRCRNNFCLAQKLRESHIAKGQAKVIVAQILLSEFSHFLQKKYSFMKFRNSLVAFCCFLITVFPTNLGFWPPWGQRCGCTHNSMDNASLAKHLFWGHLQISFCLASFRILTSLVSLVSADDLCC